MELIIAIIIGLFLGGVFTDVVDTIQEKVCDRLI